MVGHCCPYTGSDAGQITVGGELNKLANNVALGRDMAGVHWGSDAEQALLLSEKGHDQHPAGPAIPRQTRMSV
jgi:hypothetical protein